MTLHAMDRVLLAVSAAVFCQGLAAATIDFEDVAGADASNTVSLGSYQGFNWTGTSVMDPWLLYGGQYVGWGYSVGQTTPGGSKVAWGPANGAGVSSTGTFNFTSAYFTHYGGGVFRSTNLTVRGLRDGGEVYSSVIAINSSSPTYFAPGWENIDELTFSMADFRNWVMDDFSYTSAVPLPAAIWLFGSALAGLGVVARRKT